MSITLARKIFTIDFSIDFINNAALTSNYMFLSSSEEKKCEKGGTEPNWAHSVIRKCF